MFFYIAWLRCEQHVDRIGGRYGSMTVSQVQHLVPVHISVTVSLCPSQLGIAENIALRMMHWIVLNKSTGNSEVLTTGTPQQAYIALTSSDTCAHHGQEVLEYCNSGVVLVLQARHRLKQSHVVGASELTTLIQCIKTSSLSHRRVDYVCNAIPIVLVKSEGYGAMHHTETMLHMLHSATSI